ncbi:MAG: hypothetical protein KIT15_12355 [Xanthobacteraceae bacterium]|nr:hypothetical protein [Xanthobacteraceae bacterium]MCW5675360.1 hypothetical protein [Xanthobacteraceae bacterium]MCW5676597.1 hypothetical protein [Xanthobacteraceae bacterium]
MEREFTRFELYELVWSQPMTALSAEVGISSVALAKHCKKLNVPVPGRGYWARIAAGQPIDKPALPLRFPGASDRTGGDPYRIYSFNRVEEYAEMAIPPEPIFEEEIPALRQRVSKLVGRVRHARDFQSVHPLVARHLEHDEERRADYKRSPISLYQPKYDGGIERRRLLIINTLFQAAARLGCRASMSTSRYVDYYGSDRQLGLKIAESYVGFTIEPLKSKNKGRESLSLSFTRSSTGDEKSLWSDEDGRLESKLTEILIEMLVTAEVSYRRSLIAKRQWLIDRKAEAQAELVRRQIQAEQEAREREERLARERVGRLLTQAKMIERADRIRTYATVIVSRADRINAPAEQVAQWAAWARQEADRIDPSLNGTLVADIAELPKTEAT